VVLGDAPRAYLRLGETTGVVAKDSVGTANGSYQAVMLGYPGALAGDPDTSVHFEGVNAAVVLGDVLDVVGGAAFTFEIWAKPEAYDTSYRRIFTKLVAPSASEVDDGYSLSLQQSVRPLSFDVWRDAGGGGKATWTSSLELHKWSHVVITYDTTTLLMFVNGAIVGTWVTTVNMIDNTANLVLGSLSTAQYNNWEGELDEFAVYDHALSPPRVKLHYDTGTTPP
jgi:hypothetical protein